MYVFIKQDWKTDFSPRPRVLSLSKWNHLNFKFKLFSSIELMELIGIYDNLWQFITMYDNVWQCMTIYDYLYANIYNLWRRIINLRIESRKVTISIHLMTTKFELSNSWSKTFQNVFGCKQTFQNVFGCKQTFQNVFGCKQTFQNVFGYKQTCLNMWPCQNISKRFWM